MTQDAAELRTTRVDLSGLLAVLGEHLYSTPAVALRELVQNAHDSCVRREIEDPNAPPGRIVVRAGAKTLAIEDNGAGLTRREIHDYLATVGAGATRALRAQTSRDDLIGLFGLGFLSTFVVGERVTVHTTSYQEPDAGHRYQTRGGERYTLEAEPPREIGTVVEIDLREAYASFADPVLLRRILAKYGSLLRVGVWIDGDDEPINAEPPPWRIPPGEHPLAAKKRRCAFASRFERRFEPICTMDATAGDGSDVRGLLWVQDGATYGTSDNRNVAVFVRGMLVDDDARELLPRWAGFVGGVVESAALSPTASREDLQRDAAFEAAAKRLSSELARGLAEVARAQPEAWRRVLVRHNEALLGAAVVDDRLFELAMDDLTVPTSEGDLTARALFRRGDGKAYVSLSSHGGFEEMLARALKIPVAGGTRYGVIPFLHKVASRRGGSVVELGTESGNRHVLKPVKLAETDRKALTELLAGPGQVVVGASFSPATLPLLVMPDRDAELKKRLESDEADKRIASATLRLARSFTSKIDGSVEARLYVNVDCPAIQRLLEATRSGRPTARAGKLLTALVALLAGAGDRVTVDLAPALESFTEVVASLAGEEAR